MKFRMKSFSIIFFSILSTIHFAFADYYPVGPDPVLTPGSLCDQPDSYRYPEHIPYCKRDVEGELKWAIIHEYNDKLGYSITQRNEYKIDHFIPLCMGGSNHRNNLWPQHKTVYQITDAMEAKACEKMRDGHLSQKHAVELIRAAKLNLEMAPAIEQQIDAL